MDDTQRTQIETYLSRLDSLMRRGRDVRDALATDPANASALVAARVWQEECGAMVNQLSGGSKAHWLAKAFSEAFLVRSAAGGAGDGVSPVEIVNRLLGVLEQAVGALSQGDAPALLASSEAPPAQRFDFVYNPELRPILEQAYSNGRRGLEQEEYDLALLSYCSILEAIVTDALERKGFSELTVAEIPTGKIADWPFDTRLIIAEKTGLIRGGCARLPAIARAYGDLINSNGENGPKAKISEREARQTGQVLHVVMRDLNPGR